jgi:L-alanine-DL-glutamate epimerase-like enolase superfamily enzyme
LVDIALWDIHAQRQGLPLTAVLGSGTADAPLMAVAGYFSDNRTVAELVEETQRFVDDGYTTLKLILPGHDHRADLHLLDTMRAAHPDHISIAVDFHGAFDSVPDAMSYCEDIHQRGVRFIEDPFPSLDWHNVADFTSRSPTPVASGEDLVNLTGFDDLLGAGVRYLRVDVTASGGYTTGLAALQAAERHSAHVAPHVWPHFHAPLAAASSSVATIEVIPDHVGADPLWHLLSEPAPIHGGTWLTPTAPGLALPLDMDAVSFHAVDSWSSPNHLDPAPVTAGGPA